MEISKVYTIGVYGYDEKQFFDLLIVNKIDLFIDIRRRRGVRGSKYAFVNSTRLQNKLLELNIKYLHLLELAPTRDIRETQKVDDEEKGITKASREVLGEKFVKEYTEKILNKFNSSGWVELVKSKNSARPVLFCVEGNSNACHRSLVVNRLSRDFNLPILNL